MSAALEAFERCRDRLRAMPLGSQATVAGLLLVLVFGLVSLVRSRSGDDYDLLFGGRTLSEAEADAVELAFSQAGLSDWRREERQIRVPRSTRSEYLSTLRDASSLPLALRSRVEEALDRASPFESSEQRSSRESHAKVQDLGRKISAAFPDVRWASVEYDRGERSGLSRARPQSASVVVSPEGTEALAPGRIAMIKELVRASYAGMTSDDIVVIDTNADEREVARHGQDPLLRRRVEEERFYEEKVQRALVGYGPVRVATHVELNLPPGDEAPRLVASEVAGSPGVTVKRVRVTVGLPSSFYDKLLQREVSGKTASLDTADGARVTEEARQRLRDETEARIRAVVTPLLPREVTAAERDSGVYVWDYPDLPEANLARELPPQRTLSGLASSGWYWLGCGFVLVIFFVAAWYRPGWGRYEEAASMSTAWGSGSRSPVEPNQFPPSAVVTRPADDESRSAGHQDSASTGAAAKSDPEYSLSFLASVDEAKLLVHLREEHPQTVAIVLASVPPGLAARLVSQLGFTLRAAVIRRLSKLELPSSDVMDDIAAQLRTRLLLCQPTPVVGTARTLMTESDAVGGDTTPLGLAALRSIFGEMAAAHPVEDSFEAVSRRGSFAARQVGERAQDRLASASPRRLREALARVETRQAMLALCGLPPAVAEAVLSSLPRRQAKQVRKQITNLGKLELREIDQALAIVAAHLDGPSPFASGNEDRGDEATEPDQDSLLKYAGAA